jgi:hypothetical protein
VSAHCDLNFESILHLRFVFLQSVYVKKGAIFFKSTHAAAVTQVTSECTNCSE